MKTMRNIITIGLAISLVALASSSCSTSLSVRLGGNSAAYIDDLYGTHDVVALAKAEQEIAAANAKAKAEQEKRIAAMVAASNAASDIDDILADVELGGTYVATNSNGGGDNISIYNNIYVDDYSSAYARRLRGFTSMSYSLPSAYYDFRYGDAYFLTLAYDPAFYTVMVVGDQVWVEPRYITNMFGSWNNPYYYSYRYGYNPYYYGYSYGYYDYWGWRSPYWGCDPFYHYYSHHYWHDHYYHNHHHNHHTHHPGYHSPNHRPGGPGGSFGNHGGGKPKVEHRPSYGTGGSVAYPGGNRPSYNDRLGGGGIRDNNRGATQIASGNRGTSNSRNNGAVTRPGSSSARPGSTSSTGVRGSNNFNTGAVQGEVNDRLSGGDTRLNSNLKESLTESTLRSGSSRGNATTGRSNSSSRSSSNVRRSSGSSSSSATRSNVSSSSSSSKRNNSSRSSTVSSSSRSSFSSGSSRSSSSSSRSSVSSGSSRSSSSSSRSSLSSGSSRSSSSFSSGSSRSSSSSSRSSSRR